MFPSSMNVSPWSVTTSGHPVMMLNKVAYAPLLLKP